MKRVQEKNVTRFDQDILENRGYLCADLERLSCRLATTRITQAVNHFAKLKGKKVIDLGCGDGTFVFEFLNLGPSHILGLDASHEAIRIARQKTKKTKNVHFDVMDIYDVHKIKKHFDVAVVRGMLHHLYRPQDAIASISKIADTIIVVEPNGFNPVLKIIEKVSPYHVAHEEKSFFPTTLNSWFKSAGAQVVESTYCGLVPFFCPDWLASRLKAMEPVIERIPIIRQLSCAQYVFKVRARPSLPIQVRLTAQE